MHACDRKSPAWARRAVLSPSMWLALPVWALLGACSDAGVVPDADSDGVSDATADTAADAAPDTGILIPDSATDDAATEVFDDADTVDSDVTDTGGDDGYCRSNADCTNVDCVFIDPFVDVGVCAEQCGSAADCAPDEVCALFTVSGDDRTSYCVLPSICIDPDGDGWGTGNGCLGQDCNQDDGTVNFGATEVCDGFDNDCDGRIDDVGTDIGQACGTGFPGRCAEGRTVCEGGQLSCVPLAELGDEVCDTLDNDCDGFVDGTVCEGERCCWNEVCQGVCAIATRDVSGECSAPAAFGDEVCDTLDNDCDGEVDEDLVGEGAPCDTGLLGICAAGVLTCGLAGQSCVALQTASTEVCDGLDNDCNGVIDDSTLRIFYRDADGDGIGTDLDTVTACAAPEGYSAIGGDCDDARSVTYPGAPELCDGLDNDCDGARDDNAGTLWYPDGDLDTWGAIGDGARACTRPPGFVATTGDCNDSDPRFFPGATEVCDTVDNDCDGSIDEGATTTWYRDADGDSFGASTDTRAACSAPEGYVVSANDCNDAAASINPAAAEVCDGLDNDCDRATDEGVQNQYWVDADGDTYGSTSAPTLRACSAPAGYVNRGLDCDDSTSSVRPGQPEVCGNSADDNCNGTLNEGC